MGAASSESPEERWLAVRKTQSRAFGKSMAGIYQEEGSRAMREAEHAMLVVVVLQVYDIDKRAGTLPPTSLSMFLPPSSRVVER